MRESCTSVEQPVNIGYGRLRRSSRDSWVIGNMAAGIFPFVAALRRPLLANESSAEVLLDYLRMEPQDWFFGHQHSRQTTFKLPHTKLALERGRI